MYPVTVGSSQQPWTTAAHSAQNGLICKPRPMIFEERASRAERRLFARWR
jgi:hypothetical protein